MPDGAGLFIQDFSGPGLLRILAGPVQVSCTGVSPSAPQLSSRLPLPEFRPLASPKPRGNLDPHGLGSSAFAHHYSRNHVCSLFLQVLRCFSSLRSPMHSHVTGLQPAGLPHSDIRGFNGYLHLPAAFRSLSRPSSPPRAKASALRPYPLSSRFCALAHAHLSAHMHYVR